MQEKPSFVEITSIPDKKRLQSDLDKALVQYLEASKKGGAEPAQEKYLALFRQFAETDVSFGADYLTKFSKKAYGHRFFGTVEATMLGIVAEFDPNRAMQIFLAEFCTKEQQKKYPSELRSKWASFIITPKNAEAVFTNLESHTPNAAFVEMYKHDDFKRSLAEKAILSAAERKDVDRILELTPDFSYQIYNASISKLLSEPMLERLNKGEHETDLKKREQLVLDALTARVTHWNSNEDVCFALDTKIEEFLNKMSEEAIWKMAEKSKDALKRTLEEEVVLRMAQKNPETIFEDKYKEVRERKGMKTLLYGVITDQSILERLGEKPSPSSDGYWQPMVFGNTAQRHFDVASSAAMILGPNEEITIYHQDEKNEMVGDTVNQSLHFAQKQHKRHPEDGGASLERAISLLDRCKFTEANKKILSSFIKEYPSKSIQLLKTMDSVDVQRFIFQHLPEASLSPAVHELFIEDPKKVQDILRGLFSDEDHLSVFGRHLHEYPSVFVDSYFEQHWALHDQKINKSNYGFGISPYRFSNTSDISLLWKGVTKEMPQFAILHTQLEKKFGSERAVLIERIIASPKLEDVRKNLGFAYAGTAISELINESTKTDKPIEEHLNALSEAAVAFGHAKKIINPDQTSSPYWGTIGDEISNSIPGETKDIQYLTTIFSDPRLKEINDRWGQGVATHVALVASKERITLDACEVFLNDIRLLRFDACVRPEISRAVIRQCLAKARLPKTETLLETLSSPSFAKIIGAFPWFQNRIETLIQSAQQGKLKELVELATNERDPEIWLCEIAKNFPREEEQNEVVAEFPKLDISKLILGLKTTQANWKLISRLPPEHIVLFRDQLVEAASRPSQPENGDFANKVVAKSLQKITGSKEQFVAGLPHARSLEGRLESLAWDVHTKETRLMHETSTEAVIIAQEEIGNKHLRDSLQDAFFVNPFFFAPKFLEAIPKDATASLPILSHWFVNGEHKMLEIPYAESSFFKTKLIEEFPDLQRFVTIFFSGQVFKKRTDLDRFNYFLVEAFETEKKGDVQEKKNKQMATFGFLKNGMRLMEVVPEAKKRFFGITQQIRNLGFLDKNEFDLAVLQSQVSTDQAVQFITDEFASLESAWRTDLAQKIDLFKLELNKIDSSSEDAEKQTRKIQQKISQAEQKLAAGFQEPARVSTETQKRIQAFLERVAEDLDKKLMESFEKLSGLPLTQEEIGRLFEKYKNPSDLSVYLGKLKSAEDPKQRALFTKHLKSVSDGTFPEVRYTGERKHLDVVFKNHPEQEAKWKELISFQTIHTAESESGRSARARMEEFVKEAIAHKHIEGNLAEALDEFLRVSSSERKDAVERLSHKIKELKDLGNEPDKLKDSEVAYKIMQILNMTSGELKQDLRTNTFFEEMKDGFSADHPFVGDLAAMKGIVESLRSADKGKGTNEFVTVEETEDPDLLLRLGTDVAGSCQNINGTPAYNRNLVSYVMDGKIKTLIVRDNSKTILGRALLRVLFDETAKKPVLQLERSYHRDGTSVDANTALLIQIATQRAEQMGYDLVGTQEYQGTGKPPFEHELVSYGGPGSTEYVDSGQGQRVNGQYTIEANKLVVLKQAT